MRGDKTLKLNAWKAVSAFVRKRDPFCVCWGKPTTEVSHFFHNTDKPSGNIFGGNELWFDIRNLNGGCFYCNRMMSGNLALYALYLEKKYGHGILQELRRLYGKPKKWTREELQAVIEKYKPEKPL